MLIDDFTNAPDRRWRLVTDQVMGGVSSRQVTFGRDPEHVHLTGRVSTDNNGGFVQVRRDLDPWPRDIKKLALTVRGNGQTYYVGLRMTDAARPWHSYRASFNATPDWVEVAVPIAVFKPSHDGLPPLDLTRLRAIGFLAYGRNHQADLSIARITAE